MYLSNYASLHLKEEIARIPGISDVTIFGQRDYSMRVWVNPDKLAELGLTPGDVVAAIRGQNAQIAANLSRSTRTVEHHIASILAKLAVATRSEAVDAARRRGLLAQDG